MPKKSRAKFSGIVGAHLFMVAAALLCACKPTRFVAEGEHLLVRNTVHIEDGAIAKEDIQAVLKQKPNRKIFGVVPFHLSVWNTAKKRNKDGRFNQYLLNNVGEAPVIFEPVLLEKSEEQVRQYMINHGYFDAAVQTQAWLNGKTAELHYYVHPGKPYKLRKIAFSFEDTALIREFRRDIGSLLAPGDRFDADLLDRERERISRELKNRGYYTFDKQYLRFDVDTNLVGEKFDITVRFLNMRDQENINGTDSIVQKRHLRHYINNIVVNTDYRMGQGVFSGTDTIFSRDIAYLGFGKPAFRPERLNHFIYVEEGSLYNLSKTEYTYDRLNSLRNFKMISISFAPVETEGDARQLDMLINLSPAEKQSLTLETVGTNRSGNLGVEASLTYGNKNTFRGAERLDLRLVGGLEYQRSSSSLENQSQAELIENFTPFNTYEYGLEAGITVPDFIWNRTSDRLPYFKEPKSTLNFAFNSQSRPQYERNLFNASYQLAFKTTDRNMFTLSIMDVSYINLEKTPEFTRQLQRTNNSLLINSYNDHLIPATRLSYSFTTQEMNKLKNFYYVKFNIEGAGNLARLAAPVFNAPFDAETNSYKIFDIRFAQYLKADGEFNKYVILNKSSQFVYRILSGVGFPYKNLNVLPFERSFFAGGSNDMRAWRSRSLGPGGFFDTLGVDQVGEMQLELNLEYRFALTKLVEGALFTDIGNVWLLRYDPQRSDAEFSIKRFYKEFAIGPGVGLRLNFNFFILRFDVGYQAKDPGLPEGERWFFQSKDISGPLMEQVNQRRRAEGFRELPPPHRINFNFGINYPF